MHDAFAHAGVDAVRNQVAVGNNTSGSSIPTGGTDDPVHCAVGEPTDPGASAPVSLGVFKPAKAPSEMTEAELDAFAEHVYETMCTALRAHLAAHLPA